MQTTSSPTLAWRIAALMTSACVAYLTAGCSSTSYANTASTYAPKVKGNDYAEMNQEFEAEKASLRLPPSFNWPREAAKAGQSDRYGQGYGASHADQFWYCSWAKEWLQAREVNTTRAHTALIQLESVKEKPLYQIAFAPGVRIATNKEIDAARANNPAPLRQTVSQYC